MLSKYASLLRGNRLVSIKASRALSCVLREEKTVIRPKFKEYSYAMCKADHLHLLCDTVRIIL